MRTALWLMIAVVLAGIAAAMDSSGLAIGPSLTRIAMGSMLLQFGLAAFALERLPTPIPAWDLRPEWRVYFNAASYWSIGVLMLATMEDYLSSTALTFALLLAFAWLLLHLIRWNPRAFSR